MVTLTSGSSFSSSNRSCMTGLTGVCFLGFLEGVAGPFSDKPTICIGTVLTLLLLRDSFGVEVLACPSICIGTYLTFLLCFS